MPPSLFDSEASLKTIPRLRWRLDDDNCVIAIAKRNPYRGDHLYFHGAGKLGVYYQAKTTYGAGCRIKFYRKLLGERIIHVQDGDVDGLITFRAESETDIPELFKKSAVVGEQVRARMAAKPSRGARDAPESTQAA